LLCPLFKKGKGRGGGGSGRARLSWPELVLSWGGRKRGEKRKKKEQHIAMRTPNFYPGGKKEKGGKRKGGKERNGTIPPPFCFLGKKKKGKTKGERGGG